MGNKLGKQKLWSNHGEQTEHQIVIETEPGQVLDGNEGSQRIYVMTMPRSVQHFFDIFGAAPKLQVKKSNIRTLSCKTQTYVVQEPVAEVKRHQLQEAGSI